MSGRSPFRFLGKSIMLGTVWLTNRTISLIFFGAVSVGLLVLHATMKPNTTPKTAVQTADRSRSFFRLLMPHSFGSEATAVSSAAQVTRSAYAAANQV